jgi:endonuclease YncB( thermonuclease family)
VLPQSRPSFSNDARVLGSGFGCGFRGRICNDMRLFERHGAGTAADDGREVRLAAIEVPPLPLPQESNPAPGGAAAKDALAALLSSAQVTIKQAEPQKTDRYGRLVAYAFAARDGAEHSVQADLVAAGFARVAARVGSWACAAELLGRENIARKAKLGLWASSYYDLLNADHPTDVLA